MVPILCDCKMESSVRKREIYAVAVNRVVGRTQQYVIVCLRETPITQKLKAIGRATLDAPSNAAKDRAVLNCLLDGKKSLLSPCRHGKERFEMEANKLLHICSRARLLPPGSKAPNPRKFKKNRCSADFVAYTGSEIGGLWICQCFQPNYIVVVGRAFFSTKFAPGTASNEIETVQKCSISTAAQLKTVCFNTPGDFELLALQILQVCCKRARVAGNAKFPCAAAAPSKVQKLKFFSLF